MPSKVTKPFFPENKLVEWIARPELLRRVREALVKNKNFLGFLSAPGGYGKTVIAIQFLDGVRGPKYWLSIGEEYNEPAYFYQRMLWASYSLAEKEPPKPGAGGCTLGDLLDALDRLPSKNKRCYLAWDDFHILHNEELLSRLPLILSRLPGWVTLLVTSRFDPPSSLRELPRSVTVFTEEDLLFTLDDALQLYEIVCGEGTGEETLPRAALERLHTESGGWALGLRALLLDAGGQARPGRSRTPGRLSEYLDRRVWESWDEDTRALLMRLSVADTLTPELAALLIGREEGRPSLAELGRRGAFLSRIGEDSYRFHDLFLHYLRQRAAELLSTDEYSRLLSITADWAYRRGRYLDALRYYIENEDFAGINICVKETARFNEAVSLEAQYHFCKLYINGMDEAFLFQSLYLLEIRIWVAYLNGEAEVFSRYLDVLFQKLPEAAPAHPELTETAVFIGGLNFNVPLPVYARQMRELMGGVPLSPDRETNVSNITQELPYFHRSMRDFSEYYAMDDGELELLRGSFGVMIGRDYQVMDHCLLAGLYYEKNDLILAARHAIEAYLACDSTMQAETLFSANMILAAVLTAMNDFADAERIYGETEALVTTERASFLRPNFHAMQTRRAIQSGNRKKAAEWLALYEPGASRLPFYQICRHFTTLRAYILLEEYDKALDFGERLRELTVSYKRPLDEIECGILLALALWAGGARAEGLAHLEKAVATARSYGFTRSFINEGQGVFPLLLALKETASGPEDFGRFIDKLLGLIYTAAPVGQADSEKQFQLTPRMKEMLVCLAQGMSYGQISEATGLSLAAVKYHVIQLYKTMGVKNAQEAVNKARLLGLVKQEESAL